MYIKKKFARLAVALLAVILIACQLGIFSIAAEEPASEKTVVIAGSDSIDNSCSHNYISRDHHKKEKA